jgi:hypothetical protein
MRAFDLFRLQVGIFAGDVVDAGARLEGVQVVVTYDHGTGIAPVKFFEQSSHSGLLRLGARVGGLTSYVEPALVADAYRVGVVVQAVGSDHVLRTAWLDLSVTTDHVVVADAEVKPSLAMPRIYLGGRTHLVGFYCRTVNDNQCNRSHATPQLTAPSAVSMAVATDAMICKVHFRIAFLFMAQSN